VNKVLKSLRTDRSPELSLSAAANLGSASTPAHFTTAPVQAGDTHNLQKEFGRWRDVERMFGIKRGTLYNLMAEGKVKSVVLRRKGNIHGCRLFHLASVSEYLNGLMETQKTQ
jgi:hypothetical protein